MLPLLAFPTQLVWDKFRPVRGFAITHANPDWDEAMDLASMTRKSAFFDVVAKEFGYDLGLLADGEGETGLSGHHWVVYGRQGAVPQLIRWTPGKGNVLISHDHGHPSLLRQGPWIVLQADRDAMPYAMRLVRALAAQSCANLPFEAKVEEIVGRRVVDPHDRHGFSRVVVLYVIDPDKPVAESLSEEVSAYFHSADVEFLSPTMAAEKSGFDAMAISPGDRIFLLGAWDASPTVLHVRKEEPLPPSILRVLHHESIADTAGLMQLTLENRLNPDEDEMERSYEAMMAWRNLSNEAKLANDERLTTLTGLMDSWTKSRQVEVFFSEAFKYPMDPDHEMPRSDISPKGPRLDLLAMGIELAIGDEFDPAPSRAGDFDFLELLAKGVNRGFVREFLSGASVRYAILNRPHMAAFKGLPVKIEQELIVRRKHLPYGLAFQYAKVDGPNGKRCVVFSRLRRHLEDKA